MFGFGNPCSFPICSQPVMCPYDVPVPQPYPCPVPVPQPCIQNFIQPVEVPIRNTIQPVMIPHPVGVPVPQPFPVPIERPCAVPVPQPVAVPIECPCPVPVPVYVPVPQPCPVPQPIIVRSQVHVPVPMPVPTPVQVPVPYPCSMPQYYSPSVYYDEEEEEEYMDEPIYMKRRHRHRHSHHHHHHHRRHHRPCTPIPAAPLPPIIIPVPVQGPAIAAEQPPLQVTEYVQDIYPPAQVFTDQVPVGFIANNSFYQQPGQMQNQQSLNCQSGMILPPAPFVQPPQQQLMQQLSGGQVIERPLNAYGGGGGIQSILSSPQPYLSPCNSNGLISPCLSGTQLFS